MAPIKKKIAPKLTYQTLLESTDKEFLKNKDFLHRFTKLNENPEKEIRLMHRRTVERRTFARLNKFNLDDRSGGKNTKTTSYKLIIADQVLREAPAQPDHDLRTQQFNRAVVWYSEALVYAPEGVDPETGINQLGHCYQNRSRAFFALGRFEDALRDLQATVDAGDELDDESLLNRYESLVKLGRFSQAGIVLNQLPKAFFEQSSESFGRIDMKLMKLISQASNQVTEDQVSEDNQLDSDDHDDLIGRCSDLYRRRKIHEMAAVFGRIVVDRSDCSLDAKLYAKLHDFALKLVTRSVQRVTPKLSETLNSAITDLSCAGRFEPNPTFRWLHSSVSVERFKSSTGDNRDLLVTTESVKAGTILAVVEPYLTFPNRNIETSNTVSCGHCLAPLNHTSMKRLSTRCYRSVPCCHCVAEQYCSEECRHQGEVVDRHSAECRFRGWLESHLNDGPYPIILRLVYFALRIVMKVMATECRNLDQLRQCLANPNSKPTSLTSILERLFVHPTLSAKKETVELRIQMALETCLLVQMANKVGGLLQKTYSTHSAEEDLIFVTTVVYRLVRQLSRQLTLCTRLNSEESVAKIPINETQDSVMLFEPTLALLLHDVCDPMLTYVRLQPEAKAAGPKKSCHTAARLYTLTAVRPIAAGTKLTMPQRMLGSHPGTGKDGMIYLWQLWLKNFQDYQELELRCECGGKPGDGHRVLEYAPICACDGMLVKGEDDGDEAWCLSCEETIDPDAFHSKQSKLIDACRSLEAIIDELLMDLQNNRFRHDPNGPLSRVVPLFEKVIRPMSYSGAPHAFELACKLYQLYLQLPFDSTNWLFTVLEAWDFAHFAVDSLSWRMAHGFDETNLLRFQFLKCLLPLFMQHYQWLKDFDLTLYSDEIIDKVRFFIQNYERLSLTMEQTEKIFPGLV